MWAALLDLAKWKHFLYLKNAHFTFKYKFKSRFLEENYFQWCKKVHFRQLLQYKCFLFISRAGNQSELLCVTMIIPEYKLFCFLQINTNRLRGENKRWWAINPSFFSVLRCSHRIGMGSIVCSMSRADSSRHADQGIKRMALEYHC